MENKPGTNGAELDMDALEQVSGSGSVPFSHVKITSNTHVYTKIDSVYAERVSVSSGDTLPCLGSSKTDTNGVEWYKVYCKGITSWVSSKYATPV